MKKKWVYTSIKIGVVILLIVFFVLFNEVVLEKNRSHFKVYEDDDYFAYQIESAGVEGKDFVIRGWFFEMKKSRNTLRHVVDNRKTGILLYDLSSNIEYDMDGNEKEREGIALDIEYSDRNDVNNYFECEYDYSHCGFIAKTDVSNVNLNNGEYQIIIKPSSAEPNGIPSNAYLNKGKLQYIEPRAEIDIDLGSPEWNEIIKKGECLVSSPEHQVYVYQYDRKLYWIAGKGFLFDDNGKTGIQYQIVTTQFDKLPEERTSNGWYWGNESATFEEYELMPDNYIGEYRISVRDIPNNYSVVRILTGQYINGNWIWRKDFRPMYYFNGN